MITRTIDASTKTKLAVNLIVDRDDVDVIAYALKEGIRGGLCVEQQDRILKTLNEFIKLQQGG